MSYALKRRAIPPARDPANRGTLEAMTQAVNELAGTLGENVDRAVRVGELVEAGVLQLNPAGLLERKTIADGPIEITDVNGLQAALNGKANISGQAFTGQISAPGISTNGAGLGYIQMVPGSATLPGYLAFFTPDNTRRAYLGWGNGGNSIQFQSENGWGVEFNQAPKVAGNAVWHAGTALNYAGHDANINNITKPGEWATNGISGTGFPVPYVSAVNLHTVTNVGMQLAGYFGNVTEAYIRTKWDNGGFNPWARLWTDLNTPAPIKSTLNNAGRYHASDGTTIDNAINEQGFDYATGNAPFLGPVLTFGGLFGSSGYRGQIHLTYSGATPRMVFRHRDGDNGTWSSWVEPLNSASNAYTRASNDATNDPNAMTGYSDVSSVYMNTNSPFGAAWYNTVNIRHRGGAVDGTAYGGQIAFPMLGTATVAAFRNQENSTWKPWQGLVTSDMTILRVLKVTQAAYDALGTKDAATAYYISG